MDSHMSIERGSQSDSQEGNQSGDNNEARIG